jgi:hypothetical protein
MKRPMDTDQRIFTGKDAWVLHTIHRKENSCPTQTQIVIMAEETKNQYYVRQ